MIARKGEVGVIVLALLFGAALPAMAQESEGTGSEFLPEIAAFFKVSELSRIIALGSYSNLEGSNEPEYELGLFWDHRLSDRIQLRGGYRYKQSNPEDGPVKRESRIQLQAELRLPVSKKVLATDRNLVELRWIDGNPSQRYRNRLTVESEIVGLFGKAHTFYGSAEVFYDTRYEAWNHQEYTAGVQTLLSQKLLVDIYYQRQDDSRSSPKHINAVGLTLQLFLDARRKHETGVVIDPPPVKTP